ncbi:MAG: HAD-IIB family hydrolase [Planctomycetaceae bacterium]
MRIHVLAADYDGTLAHDGVVARSTIDALKRLRDSARRLVMVTGRRLEPLLELFPEASLFERIVAENGALIYEPATGEDRLLASPPPQAFVDTLRRRGVKPMECGRCIVATWQPHEHVALEVIRDMALEIQIIFNKDAVMLLPSGVNKAAGLAAALEEIGMSAWNTVAVGDAENDQAMLQMCAGAAAVSNALPSVKEMANITLVHPRGEGVEELVDILLANDLDSIRLLPERGLVLGTDPHGSPFTIPDHGESVLVTGGPGGGKSSFAISVLEQLTKLGAQCCVIDPEGDYQTLHNSVRLGSAKRPPSIEEVTGVLEQPREHCIVSLFGLDKPSRPAYFDQMRHMVAGTRSQAGRPHWIIVDEAHYAAPRGWVPAETWTATELQGMMFITAYLEQMSDAVLRHVDWIISIADEPQVAIVQYCRLIGEPPPSLPPSQDRHPRRALAWKRADRRMIWFTLVVSHAEQQRHLHSCWEGEVDDTQQFIFRGGESKLKLAAPNLKQFIHIAGGVDDDTWNYHLQRGDYSRWLRDVIRVEELADKVESIERSRETDAGHTRKLIFDHIQERFVSKHGLPAVGTPHAH